MTVSGELATGLERTVANSNANSKCCTVVVARIVRWIGWARVIRGRRLPAIGRPNAEILHHGPPPAYARGQAAVGGAEPAVAPRVHPGILRGGAPAAVVSEEVALIAKFASSLLYSPLSALSSAGSPEATHPVLVNAPLPDVRPARMRGPRSSGTAVRPSGAAARFERTLLLCTRGVKARHRHLLHDLLQLLPHGKLGSKLPTEDGLSGVLELCENGGCGSSLLLDARDPRRLFLWAANCPDGPSAMFQVVNTHTVAELQFDARRVSGARNVLVFDPAFNESAEMRVLKALLTNAFAVPSDTRSGRQSKARGVCHCRSIRQRAARRTACGQDGTDRKAPEQARAVCQRDTGAFSELLAQATLKLDPCGAIHVEFRTSHLATLAPAHHAPAFGRHAEATPREPPVLDARFGPPCPYPTPTVLTLTPSLSP